MTTTTLPLTSICSRFHRVWASLPCPIALICRPPWCVRLSTTLTTKCPCLLQEWGHPWIGSVSKDRRLTLVCLWLELCQPVLVSTVPADTTPTSWMALLIHSNIIRCSACRGCKEEVRAPTLNFSVIPCLANPWQVNPFQASNRWLLRTSRLKCSAWWDSRICEEQTSPPVVTRPAT